MASYTIEMLQQVIEQSGKHYDCEKIMRAYAVAEEAHRDQKRKSGEQRMELMSYFPASP